MAMKQAMLSEALQRKIQEADIESIHAIKTAIVGGQGKSGSYIAMIGAREDSELFAIVLTSYQEAQEYAFGLLGAAKEVFGNEPKPKLDA